MNSPGVAIYKPPCVQLINNPFFATHQVFALLIKGSQNVQTKLPTWRMAIGRTKMAAAIWPLENGQRTNNKKHPDRSSICSPVFACFRPFLHFFVRFRTS